MKKLAIYTALLLLTAACAPNAMSCCQEMCKGKKQCPITQDGGGGSNPSCCCKK